MSLNTKLDNAYKQGVGKERGRILWLMEEERKWLRRKLNEVILVESARHAMQVKVKIATSIYEQLKMRIMAGHEAPEVVSCSWPESDCVCEGGVNSHRRDETTEAPDG